MFAVAEFAQMKSTLFAIAIAVALSAGLGMGCRARPQYERSPNMKSKFATFPYIRRNAGRGVIVFVHGVLGNGYTTWLNGTSYWPEMLTKDSTFDDQDIYVYDYPSPSLRKSYSIDDLSENMRLLLDTDRVFADHDRVVIISHSMGGLVTRSFLLKNQQYAPKISFLYFFATPTTGSPIAAIASLVSRNPQLGGMYPLDADLYLQSLQTLWLDTHLSIHSHCAFELQDTYHLKIVERQSASNLCTEQLDPIDADHIHIVKPDNDRAIPYLAFKAAFQAHPTSQQSAANRPSTTDGPTEHPETPIDTVQEVGSATLTISRSNAAIVYDIRRPPVDRAQADFPAVAFKAGDVVSIQSGGCAQTGGSGNTWKRYVDPSGPSADRLYHGLVRLPGQANLERVGSLLGRQISVAQDGTLQLGYEDDDYTDNGYWGRDPGTERQCASESDAFIRIIVNRRQVNSSNR